MRNRILFLFIVTLSSLSQASTFVGNGGNAGDLELQVSVNQMKETFKQIEKQKLNPEFRLCTCPEDYDGVPLCETVKDLSSEQVQFCSDFLKDRAGNLLQMLSENKVKFTWTHEKIDVSEDHGPRASDAVASSVESSTITINQERFLSLKASQRLFLLSHEMMHLTEFQGHRLVDQQKIGPFQSTDGGRKLLNSAGASTAVQSMQNGSMQKYLGTLNRSQGNKKFWLGVNAASDSNGLQDQGVLYVSKHGGSQFTFRYQFNDWGFTASYRSLKGDRSAFTATSGTENLSAIGVGLSFRYFPFSDPMSYWGPSHLLVTAMVENLKSRYQLTDPSLSDEDTASSTSPVLELSYYFPLQNNFWLTAGFGFSNHKYEYSKFYMNYNKPQTTTAFGVSYAF